VRSQSHVLTTFLTESSAVQLDTLVAQVYVLAILHPLPWSFPPLLTKRSVPLGMISNPKCYRSEGAYHLACVGQLRHGMASLTGGVCRFCIGFLTCALQGGRSSTVSIFCHEASFKCLSTSPERVHLDSGRAPLPTHGQVSPLYHLGIPFTYRRHDAQKASTFTVSSRCAKLGKTIPDGRDTMRDRG